MAPRAAAGAPLGIAYDDLGTGRAALLFLPGWCSSRKVFQSLPALCAERQRILALDWPGHGESYPAHGTFGEEELVRSAVEVLRHAQVERVIPVALAHSGWIALELRRRLGSAVPGIVLIDWLVCEPPPACLAALRALQREGEWQAARNGLFSMWTHGVAHPRLQKFLSHDMGSYGFDMWSRAGRAIERAYTTYRSPLAALSAIRPSVPVLHLYAQPEDAGFLGLQQTYAREHSSFRVHKLSARSHFPMFEVPETMAKLVGEFAALD